MRKQKKELKTVQLSFVIEEKHVELIDYYAKKLDLTRSKFIRNLILNGLDDTELMNAIGILQLVKMGRHGVQSEIPLAYDS